MLGRPRARLMLLLALLSACVLGTNSWWLGHNDLPDGFQNEYEHVFTLTEVFFRWRDNSLGDAWPHLWDGYYPPLNVAVGSAALAVGGSSLDLALGSLALFFVLLLVVVLLMGLRFEGAWTAALAASLIALYPAIYGNLRRFEPNLALAAMVALAVGWLVHRGRLRSWWGAAAFGLCLGVGMLADRLVFGVYLLPVLLVCLNRAWQWKGSRVALGGRWAIALVVAALVCGYYYLRFFELQHTDEVTTQLGGEVTAAGDSSANHPFWTLRGLSYYPMSWIDCQMGLVLGSLTLCGLGLYLAGARRRVDPGSRRLLEAWLLGGLLIISVVGKKQPYYSIPLLAPAALLAAAGWLSLLRRPVTRAVLLAAVLGLGSYQLARLTFGPELVPAPGKWSYLAGRTPFPPGWLDEAPYTQAAPPKDQDLWLDYAASVCRGHQASIAAAGVVRPYVFLFSDSDQAPEGQVMPRLRLAMDSRRVEGFTMSGEAVVDQASRAACLVFITSSAQHWPTFEQVGARWKQWGVGSPGEDLRRTLADLAARAGPGQVWQTSWEESVHVYTLAPVVPTIPN